MRVKWANLGGWGLSAWLQGVAFNSAVAACEKGQRWEWALELLATMQRKAFGAGRGEPAPAPHGRLQFYRIHVYTLYVLNILLYSYKHAICA